MLRLAGSSDRSGLLACCLHCGTLLAVCVTGNNAVEMETTAVFDKEADEFIINTPTTVAQKYWITNSAVHAKWSAVFAQLLIDGKNHGIHGFLVRIRNEVRFPFQPEC